MITWKAALRHLALGTILGGVMFSAANAQSTATEMMVQLYSDPDEYYFFEADRKQVVDYKTERVVRVCVGKSRHTVPLRISYDGKKSTIAPGDCTRVEAKSVSLEPDKRLDPDWVIVAEVQTLT